MDGIALAGAVKSRFPEVPVLFISSCPFPRTDLESAIPGSVFLEKPFDLRVFADTIKSCSQVVRATEDEQLTPAAVVLSMCPAPNAGQRTTAWNDSEN
jgi:FixJ family two-component response regulator